ncbi:hypothetical protein GWO43_15775 [candidate division KSB1 bacterium]|nr:hypothetical protein [candidate division KSB1 bacterium]NIR68568.1 hypothetical protein [candidate division KSB1 bacterium]NIS25410.1 hypothetical protein [candidate division KSB1 bacterium]NIT72302.1 hypothetical protein [candidate division KSB1 bacterium]NIU26086.1 hypothetical protein [candidate division KSB1 bacterium]
MAKKKKKRKRAPQSSSSLSPKKYVMTKARQLPIHECLITQDWEEVGVASILITRKHKNDKITFGLYLVDLLCLGVKDTFFEFNLATYEYQSFLEKCQEEQDWVECDYDLAHNIIYGAVEFAEKYGFKPHKDFAVTRHILKEHDENTPSMDIEFGEDGRPCLVSTVYEDPSQNIAQLDKTAGKGNYDVVHLDKFGFVKEMDDEEWDDEEDWTEWDDEWQLDDHEEEQSEEEVFELLDYLYEQKFGQERASPEQKEIKLHSYTIHFDAIESPHYALTPEQRKEAQNLYKLCVVNPKQAIPLLKEKTKQHPDHPLYYNYLANAYESARKHRQAQKIVEETYKKFPDYLFAKCNYAQYLFNKNKLDQIPAVFDNKFELKSLYPQRDEFHINEVLAFNAIMCRYFTRIDDMRTAQVYYKLLKEFEDFEHPMKEVALRELRLKKFEKLSELEPNDWQS